jgi:hypothetical protein
MWKAVSDYSNASCRDHAGVLVRQLPLGAVRGSLTTPTRVKSFINSRLLGLVLGGDQIGKLNPIAE